MDIMVRGMKMPTKGEYHMTLYVCDDGYAYMDVDLFPVDSNRFEVISVPPHGRLGDLDRMLADNEIYYNQLGRPSGGIRNSYMAVKHSIELALTVIPAEPLKEERDECS